MAMEITIFDIPDKESVSNKSQKELEYEALEKASKLDGYHFQNFYRLSILEESEQIPNSNISAVLCKYVVQFTQPIITRSGDTKRYNIIIQDEHETLAYDIDTRMYFSVPAHEQYKIVGIRLPRVFIKWFDRRIYNSMLQIKTKDIASSGKFPLQDEQTRMFTQQRNKLTHFGDPNIKHKDRIIMFSDEEKTRETLQSLIKFIQLNNLYYDQNYITLVRDLQNPPFAPVWVAVRNNNNIKNKEIPLSKLDDTTTELKMVLPNNMLGDYHFDTLATLMDNNLYYANNVGRFIGTGSPLFQKEVEQRKVINKKNDETAKFINDIDKNKLVMAKKISIAYDKYGVESLASLDRKQIGVVELEYKKLTKNLSRNDSVTAVNNRKLFYRLNKTFRDIDSNRLNEALSAIRKEIPSKQLKGNELIEGGVCPHVYAWGEVLYNNFGKPWVNTQLKNMVVNEYSLPSDRHGYFCRICGGQLAEGDTEGIVRFIGGERVSLNLTEDPLQSTIWKEAMYIISTYIKFNTPIPLKPLVNSIAQGLRNVIGEYEAKLFKSRTNTNDNVKDTVVLYANVYIYAVLCAMMMNNPSKIQFGRDDPRAGNKNSERKVVNRKNNIIQDKSEFVNDNIVIDQKTPDADIEIGISEYTNDIETNTPLPLARATITSVTDERRVAREIRRKSIRDKRAAKMGGKASQDLKKYERYVLTTALNLILITKDAIIKRMRHINADVVKQIFLKSAYLWARKHSRPIQVNKSNINEDIEHIYSYLIELDPMYGYLYYAKTVAYNAGSTKQKPSSITDANRILGRSLKKVYEDMKQDINQYETVEVPPKWSFKHGAGNKFDEYTYMSFVMELKYAAQNMCFKNIVPRHVQHAEYRKEYNLVTELESVIHKENAKRLLIPMYQVEFVRDLVRELNNFDPKRIDIAQHYCPDGKRHKIGSLIYATHSGKTEELTVDTINKWLSDNNENKILEFRSMILINEKCINCKKLVRTAVSNIKSENALSDMFSKLDDILAFYQYYETRCPEGDLHDIVNNKCSKCKMSTDTAKRSSDDNSDAYYKKYIKLYRKVESEKRSFNIEHLKEIYQEYEYGKTVASDKHKEDYNFSLKNVAEWSQIGDIKYNVIVNMGLTEGEKYEDIEKAKINPSKNIDPIKDSNKLRTQSMRIRGYIVSIVRDYSMLRNKDSVSTLPTEYKKLIEEQKKIDMSKLKDILPEIASDFITKDTKYRVSLSNINYVNFLMEYLSGMMLSLYKAPSKPYLPFMIDLAKIFTKNILSKEKLFSKPKSVYAKAQESITKMEEFSDSDTAMSGDDMVHTMGDVDESDENSDVDHVYKNEIGDLSDAYDVENVGDIWDVDD